MFSETPFQISMVSSASTSRAACELLDGKERRSKKMSITARKTAYTYALNIYENCVV